ncbi:MAG: radical SAM protein [Myxococcota bacterium]|nr:radical SAM protein [Myxococcota bacterium]
MSASLSLAPPDQPVSRVDELAGFVPATVDAEYLRTLGVTVQPAAATLAGLARGSANLRRRLATGTLVPRAVVTPARIALDSPLEIHNYTGSCPTLTYELNPVVGCHVGCLYCLVTDGSHEQELRLYANYPELVAQVLEQTWREPHFFYFSPKTEAFQEPTLATGVAHGILRAFIAHYRRHPGSRARLFVASKAGAQQLARRHAGESILDLFAELPGRMQFNTSISIMPEPLRRLLEPHAATLDERLEAVQLCQARGVLASSALIQPILPTGLTDARLDAYFARLAAAGLVNFKPELLTVAPECLAIIGQLVGHFARDEERELYEAYVAPDNVDHKKQRDRTAPDRELSRDLILRLIAAGRDHGLSASICAWVRAALGISEETIPLVNERGYQCLGYQVRLFDDAPGEAS